MSRTRQRPLRRFSAPVGLISSLLLCVVALVITKDASLAITALAASCCVCVAVMNMLAVNLPVSRLSHRLRRRGAMVSGYEGIKRMSAVNAVLVDSTELLPARHGRFEPGDEAV